jgi:hypothetical protein
MNVTVKARRRRRPALRVLGRTIFVGWVAFSIAYTGFVTTVVACVVFCVAFLVIPRALIAILVSHYDETTSEPGQLLGAGAALNGQRGVLRLFADRVQWEARRPFRQPVVMPVGDISEVIVDPVHPPFLRTALLTVITGDGTKVKIAIDASSDRIVGAFRSVA